MRLSLVSTTFETSCPEFSRESRAGIDALDYLSHLAGGRFSF